MKTTCAHREGLLLFSQVYMLAIKCHDDTHFLYNRRLILAKASFPLLPDPHTLSGQYRLSREFSVSQQATPEPGRLPCGEALLTRTAPMEPRADCRTGHIHMTDARAILLFTYCRPGTLTLPNGSPNDYPAKNLSDRFVSVI